MRQAGKLAQRPDHRIQGIGDADHKGVWREFPDAFTNRFHHFQVDAQQVIAAHPRFARYSGGDDADIGAADKGIVVGARHVGIKARNRARLRDIQRFALGGAFGNVEHHHIAKLFQRNQMGKGTADLSCANQRNLRSGHETSPCQLG